MELHILGIRHHGCGSARSVKAALNEIEPDIVLIEGAPEANEILHLAAHEEMRPPVAVLIYPPENPQNAVFYPFAEFSPEWQSLKFALSNKIEVRFIDLPQSAQISDFEIDDEKLGIKSSETDSRNPKSKIEDDPLQFAAEIAGFSDGEIWWENLIEAKENSTEIFAGIFDLMKALREESEKELAQIASNESEIKSSLREKRREAFMREEIRRAESEGFQKIAVVCGAWHAPRLKNFGTQQTDTELLKNLPKTKLRSTWIPYTYNRLAFASGYGAGIHSPEFYHQIWQNPRSIPANWLSRVAHLLRAEGLDASSASVIETVRLAEGLAVMRGLSGVGLAELFESAQAVFCDGEDTRLRLIEEKLIIGERIGEVPAATPTVPLQNELRAIQKRLRMLPEPIQKLIELDLRKPHDLEKSHLLHRLSILGIEWGNQQRVYGKGTFKENWQIQWHPEFEIKVIEASLFGNTIIEAGVNVLRERALKTDQLSGLTKMVEDVLLAEIPEAVGILMKRLQEVSALTTDVRQMMSAFSPLADVLRYGNVRKIETASIEKITDGLLTRICINLPNACASLNDESAEQLFENLIALNNSLSVLQKEDYLSKWTNTLKKLAENDNLHGLISGRTARILLEKNEMPVEEIEKRMNLSVSIAVEPSRSAAWIEGFLRGSGLILLYHEKLLNILDKWLLSLKEEVFVQLLPIIRRTFSSFEAPERRKIGEILKGGNIYPGVSVNQNESKINAERADKVLQLLEKLLGL